MNAYSRTAIGFAAALMGKRRVSQSVHVCVSKFGGIAPRFVVLVVPEGAETGEYYEVGQRVLDLLRSGTSPEELELEPHTEDDDA